MDNCPYCKAEPMKVAGCVYPGWMCGTVDRGKKFPDQDSHCRIRSLEQRAEKAIVLLEGYDKGNYGEQGDFDPGPVQDAINILRESGNG